MSLHKEDIEKTKEKIYERLDQWIYETKRHEIKTSGIERLTLQFPKLIRRIRRRPDEEHGIVPVTRSYEERLRSIFINTMQCVPPVIGEYARKLNNSLSEQKIISPALLERRKTASDSTLGRSSILSSRGISRQNNSRKNRNRDSKLSRGGPNDVNTLYIDSPSPVVTESELLNVCEIENNANESDTGGLRKRRQSQVKNKKEIKESVKQIESYDLADISPSDASEKLLVLSEIEKQKGTTKDGKVKGRRQPRREARRELRLKRQSVLEEKYIKIRATPFRRFCRMIYHIVALFRVTRRQLKREEKKNTAFERISADGEVLSFDPQDYKSASKTYGGLTKMARRALTKRQDERNDVDIMVLMEVINRMPFFQKYSMSIKRDLARCLEYDKVEAERVVIRQDHPGFKMYFVSSGKLGVRMLMTDPRTGEKIVRQIKEFTSGCYFGELALMRDTTRTATVYSKTTCELLSMTKDNFNKVLRDAWDYLRAERMNILKVSPYFKSWDAQQLEIAADVTELRDYPANKSIVGDVPGVSDYVYFITHGDCTVVRKLEMIRQKSPHLESTLHLPEDACGPSFFKKNYGHHWRKQTADVRFVTMFNLHAGDYFAVGENLTDTFIISKGKVQCLVINSVQFEIQAKTEDLQEWAAARNPMLPTNQFLYAELMANKAWYNYKQVVVEEIVKKRKIPVTTKPEDVPLSIRVEPRVLKK